MYNTKNSVMFLKVPSKETRNQYKVKQLKRNLQRIEENLFPQDQDTMKVR